MCRSARTCIAAGSSVLPVRAFCSAAGYILTGDARPLVRRMPWPLEHHQISTNGSRLHVVQSGAATGPLVLLLHGFPAFWYGWRYQLPYLAAAGYRVWAPDQRGYNLSHKPLGLAAYRLEILAADVLGPIDAAGQETACVVGHDWGGLVGWWIASHAPHRLEQLVAINAPPWRGHAPLSQPASDAVAAELVRRFFSAPLAPRIGESLGPMASARASPTARAKTWWIRLDTTTNWAKVDKNRWTLEQRTFGLACRGTRRRRCVRYIHSALSWFSRQEGGGLSK
jgi:pimeloyl-ACP methyl ester carboxylesterase